jgi:Zn-dependent protease/CBS domain-containing protein
MRSSVPLGRIAGVRFDVNLSVLVFVAILIVELAYGRFPLVLPGRSTGAYLVAAAIATVLFLASVLAHELAHAVLARRNGIRVESITLWLLGGVAQLTGEPRSPGADLRIAAAGPLTSLALGVVFGAGASGLLLAGAHGLPVAVFAYLAGVNVILAIFNLVPAAPLDGGRVLRAVLWLIWRDRPRAAIAAARTGRIFGYLLVFLGFLQVASGSGFSGLWLMLIGLFLVNGAAAEEHQARLGSMLNGVLVGDVMTAHPLVVNPGLTVEEFISGIAFAYPFSGYPLADPNGRLLGLVTLNRVRAVPSQRRAVTRLIDIACQPDGVPTALPHEPLTDLLPRMDGCADGRAVVIDETNAVVGIVTASDVSRALQVAGLRSPAYPFAA